MGVIARQLGGGRFAQSLAATAYMAGGVYLALDDYYSLNCFDHLFWALGIYILVRILQGADTRLWYLFGLWQVAVEANIPWYFSALVWWSA